MSGGPDAREWPDLALGALEPAGPSGDDPLDAQDVAQLLLLFVLWPPVSATRHLSNLVAGLWARTGIRAWVLSVLWGLGTWLWVQVVPWPEPRLALRLVGGWLGLVGALALMPVGVRDRLWARWDAWRTGLTGTRKPLASPGVETLGTSTPEPSVVPDPASREQVVRDVVSASDPSEVFSNLGLPLGPARPGLGETDRLERPIPIGAGAHTQPVTLRGRELLNGHMLVLGSTGSGKSEFIKVFAAGLLEAGWDVILLDLKEDVGPGGLRWFCQRFTESHAIPYQEVCFSEPNPRYWLNVLHGLDSDLALNLLMTAQTWDDQYWASISKDVLGQVVRLLYRSYELYPTKFDPPDLRTIARILGDPAGLPEATKERRALLKRAVDEGRLVDARFDILKAPTDHQRQAAAGLASRLAHFYNLEVGQRCISPGPDRMQVELDHPGLVYFGFSTLSQRELAVLTSTAVTLRLGVLAGERITSGVPRDQLPPKMLIIDEANLVATDPVKNLLARARSAGIVLCLCTQGATDWRLDWEEMVNNINTVAVMRAGSEENARMAADLLGYARGVQTSARVGSSGITGATLRESYDHIVGPEILRSLQPGEMFLKVGVPGTPGEQGRLEWVQVIRRTPERRP